jgi:hypothetical protein
VWFENCSLKIKSGIPYSSGFIVAMHSAKVSKFFERFGTLVVGIRGKAKDLMGCMLQT